MGQLGNKMIRIGIVYSYECSTSTVKIYLNRFSWSKHHFSTSTSLISENGPFCGKIKFLWRFKIIPSF